MVAGLLYSPNSKRHLVRVDMVLQNNAITLCEIQQRVIKGNANFKAINSVSLSTTDPFLQCNRVGMKQVYSVLWAQLKKGQRARFQYVQLSVNSNTFSADFTAQHYLHNILLTCWAVLHCTVMYGVQILYSIHLSFCCTYKTICFCIQCIELDSSEYIFGGEVGFNLTKRRG